MEIHITPPPFRKYIFPSADNKLFFYFISSSITPRPKLWVMPVFVPFRYLGTKDYEYRYHLSELGTHITIRFNDGEAMSGIFLK